MENFTDKMLDKYKDHPSIYYTGNFYKYFRNFEHVDRAERGRSADEFNNILEFEAKTSCTRSGNGCFLDCNKHVLEKILTKRYIEFKQP